MLHISCESEKTTFEPANDTEVPKLSGIDKKKMAFDLIDLLNSPSFSTTIVQELSNNNTPGIKLATLLQQQNSFSHHTAYKSLIKSIETSKKQSKNYTADSFEIPELWMHRPANKKSINTEDILISFAPEGDESEWKTITAYTLDKKAVELDPENAPDLPVIVIETKGYEVLKAEVDYMNTQLQLSGLQNDRFATQKMDLRPTAKINAGLETTKLDKIRLNNDEEPWISGAAEIYAITSGIKNAGNDPEIKIIPMYYLDHEGKDYYPNQVLLFWEDYKYQAANIQLFEKDDNHNYKNLVSVIVDGVFKIIGAVSAQPWVSVLGQVAGAIIQAMPDEWYTNSDDYVDSFYTIEKNKHYTDHIGAAGNAKATFSPLFIPEN